MPLAWGLAGLVSLLLLLLGGALQVQLALAALLQGESAWSKAQKQIVVDIQAYAVYGAPEALASFDRNYALLGYDRFARDEALKPNYDHPAVEQALSHSNAQRDVVPVVIFVFRYLQSAPFMNSALSAWRSTDSSIDELGAIAHELRSERHSQSWNEQRLSQTIARISVLNDYIQPRAEQFSRAIADGAIWIARFLFFGVCAAAALACLLWLRIARRTMAKIHGTEDRYRVLFDNAPDAIVMVDENDGFVLDANRTAADWFGRMPQELVGRRFADMVAGSMGEKAKTSTIDLLFSVDGTSRPVETQWSRVRWGEKHVRQVIIRDISERVAMEQERRIAAEALASVAEGVIIADAARKVIAVNAAHTALTGFTAEELAGWRIDDTRVLPQGESLPPSLWRQIEATGSWVGEVQARRRDGSVYDERLSIGVIRDAQGQVQRFVAVISDITASKSDRSQLEYLARHDPLTGLVNRVQFEEHCARAIAAAEQAREAVSVLFIDLDAFKAVNDSFGHAVGDRLLAVAADRVTRQLAPLDVAGRIGGDEFAVLVRGLGLREDAAGLANRLLATLSDPYRIDNNEIVISASIGVAGYPLDALDAATVIANADAAMYAAKTEERNGIRFYTPIMHAKARSRLQLAAELRQALARDELRLMFQPSIELRSGRIMAVEALLRWQHPLRGLIAPAEFVPVAENLGVVRQIDQWVMRAVLMKLKEWEQLGMPPIRVAINVSASWFGHHAFVESLSRALMETGVAPARLVLEITESSMLRLGEGTDQIMHRLHALGVSVAIDDFGTGYSSLAYLKLPAITWLKIDRSFVRGLPDANDAAIIQAVLAIGKSLGLRTVAEGIETEAQHDFLLRAGCIEGQGYLYSQPLGAAEIERLLLPDPKLVKTRLQLVSSDQT
ncbi:MAG: EAL domain-containing protein [Proteobacteria bacterium]|nr:EAL domain-containing protein [Pseudomonadota bacterium]